MDDEDIIQNYNIEDESYQSIRDPSGSLDLADFGERVVPGIPDGAMPEKKPRPEIVVSDAQGNAMPEDLRVRIRVPSKYLAPSTSGKSFELLNMGGIIFPYTPTISYEAKADYSAANPLHSNFSINFYQRSSIGSISISGRFSVQNEKDAAVYLATVHLLTALTRMRSGGLTGDSDSGAPPPVCRLDAHGEMMLNNVPVAITSFRVELPDGVDYFTLPANSLYGTTAVPVVSTIAVTCLPMYSRNEMQGFSVTGYLLDDKSYKNKGFI